MTKEKNRHIEQLVKEQLDAGHIEPFMSPWNTPIFIIPPKSGRWHLIHYLRVNNAQMQPMGSLQPAIPNPSLIPDDHTNNYRS